jgi:HTH-type transcriptional regulator / antitoxin HipB
LDYPVKIPAQLRPLLMGFRKAAGFTQAQVASRLGVTQQTYAQLEAKPESASMDRLFRILKLFKVDIVLTQEQDSASLDSRASEHVPATELPVPVKQSVKKKRATPAVAKTSATKTTSTRKAISTQTIGRGQGSRKPATGKRKAPTAIALKKREDW